MSYELFSYEKQDFAEIHIFVNNEDFEVIDCPIVHASKDLSAVNGRIQYWKSLGFKNVRYQFVRVVTKLVVKEVEA